MKVFKKLHAIPHIVFPLHHRETLHESKDKKAIARPDLTKEEHKHKAEEEKRKLAKKSKLPTDIFVAKTKQEARAKGMNKARHF